MLKSKEAKKLAKKNAVLLWTIGIIIVIGLIIFAIIYFTNPKKEVTLEIGVSPVLGSADAPLTIYEFTDFSCPYCAAFAAQNTELESFLKSRDSGWVAPVPKIIENYVSTGKAKLVFKYFPGHGAGLQAHMIALALNEQNSSLFWKFADWAYANQANIDDVEEMKNLAKFLGANMTLLEQNLQSKDYYALLKNDTGVGISIGIRGTPTFVINNKILEGPSYAQLEKEINSAL